MSYVATPQPELFSPLLLSSLLDALRRLDPEQLRGLCRSSGLDPLRVADLARERSLLAGGPLPELLPALRSYREYGELVKLAGHNACEQWLLREGIRPLRTGSSLLFRRTASRMLEAFSGNSGFAVEQRGRLQFVKLYDSVFARDSLHAHPACGFYSGLLEGLAGRLSRHRCHSTEIICRAVDPDAPCCMFEVALRDDMPRRAGLRL
jgi:hypothetical protein